MTKKQAIKTVLNRIRFIKTVFENGIHDDKTLYLFVKYALGYSIPNKKICQDHDAPFKILSDLFFQRTKNCIIMGSRGGGKTFLIVAVLNFLNMIFKKGIEITSSASIERQAKTGYKLYSGLLNKWWLPNHYIKESIQVRTSFINLSTLEIIVASMHGFNSKHPQIAIIDEVDLIDDWNILQEGFAMPMGKDNIESQMILLSTRKKATGLMQRLINQSEEMEFRVYSYCIWEVIEKCELQHDCQLCKIWERCQGMARHGEGYYRIKDLLQLAKSMDSQTWTAQVVCKKPISSGQFYDFSRENHVITPKDFCDRYDLTYTEGMTPDQAVKQTSFLLCCAIDWGFSDPTVFLAFCYDSYMDMLYVYKEFHETNLSAIDTINAWKGATRHKSGRMVFEKDHFNWNDQPFSFVVVDKNRPELRKDLNSIRDNKELLKKVTSKAENREFSFSKVRERLMIDHDTNLPKIQFFTDCTNAIREHESIISAVDGFPTRRSDDHTVDCVRYAISTLHFYFKRRELDERMEEQMERFYG